MTSLSRLGPVLVERRVSCLRARPNSKVAVRNPRSAIGMVEPGSLCQHSGGWHEARKSRGLTTVALGELFADEGCKVAYNLDGGGTDICRYSLAILMELKHALP